MFFRVSEGFLIALTYGRECEWVKNVVAAGECQLETGACATYFPHQPSCMIQLADDFRLSCARC